MNLKEEFQDYLYQIQNELLKNTSSPLYSHLLKDFMNDSDKFMSFYDFIMNSQEVYDFEIYKGLLGPLNSFGFYAEIGEVYNKMIKIVTEGGDNGVKDTRVDLDKDSTSNNTTPHPNTNTIHYSLFLVSLLDSHSSKFLRNLFSPSPSLSISLILFGDFLFENEFFYESFKVLNVVSQGIPLVGYPPKEVMDKYWFIMGYYFLREGSYYSFMNCINKENYKRFGSKGDFKKILKIIKIKNEGNEFKKLLLKRKSGEMREGIWGWCMEDDSDLDSEDKGDIKGMDQDYFSTKDYHPTINIQSLISSLVPFSYWDLYFDSLDQEIDFKDFNFISFLKKNNLDFEIKGNKIKIGKYKFKSISDKIYDIIEKYKEEHRDVKDRGNKDNRDTAPLKTSTTPSSKNTPLRKPTSTPTFLKKPLFKDNFSLNKSKFKIYSLILSKSKKNFKMKNEILLKNRKNQFENLKIKEEEKRERLRNYYEIVKELIKEIESNKSKNRDTTRDRDTTREFKNIKDHIYPNKPSKTNWRDLEVNDLQKTTYTGRQYRTKQREDDILSSRTILSFDRTEEEESKGSKVYKPNMNIKDLKILRQDGDGKGDGGKDNSREGDSNSREDSKGDSKGKYIPPHLRK